MWEGRSGGGVCAIHAIHDQKGGNNGNSRASVGHTTARLEPGDDSAGI